MRARIIMDKSPKVVTQNASNNLIDSPQTHFPENKTRSDYSEFQITENI